MAKKGFYIGLASLLLLWALPARAGAAHDLAERLYRVGGRHLATQQWEKALAAYRLTVLLDPFFAEAIEKKQAHIPQVKLEQENKQSRPKIIALPPPEMVQIKNHLERGERAEAILALTLLLREEPENERAKLLLEKVQKETEAGPEENPKFKEAEKLFKEGQKEGQQGNSFLAYQQYQKAFQLFVQADLKPYFYQELVEQREALTSELAKELEEKLEKLEKEDLEKRGPALRDLESQYPPHPRLQTLLKNLYQELQARAAPILLAAKTLRTLEGCRASVDKFAKVKAIALFPEVPSWGEAQKNIQACR